MKLFFMLTYNIYIYIYIYIYIFIIYTYYIYLLYILIIYTYDYALIYKCNNQLKEYRSNEMMLCKLNRGSSDII